jgi:hypothetical protein
VVRHDCFLAKTMPAISSRRTSGPLALCKFPDKGRLQKRKTRWFDLVSRVSFGVFRLVTCRLRPLRHLAFR